MSEKEVKTQQSYSVTLIYDASRSVDVNAASADEAEAKANDLIGRPSICHQCSDEIDLGDAIGAMVYLGDKEVLDSTPSGLNASEAKTLRADLAKLQAQHDELLKALSYIKGLAMADEPRDLPTIATTAHEAIAKAERRET